MNKKIPCEEKIRKLIEDVKGLARQADDIFDELAESDSSVAERLAYALKDARENLLEVADDLTPERYVH